MKQINILSLLILSMVILSSNSPDRGANDIFDFTPTANTLNWRIVNDDVMGGVSTSTFSIDKAGNGIFSGRVSTENYGGFASVRYTLPKAMKVSSSQKVKIRLKGDGKRYQFRLKHKASQSYSYINYFETTGKWETIELPIEAFYPSFRGRKLDMPNFDQKSFEQVSFLIANNRNEKFRLELDQITIEK